MLIASAVRLYGAQIAVWRSDMLATDESAQMTDNIGTLHLRVRVPILLGEHFA
jgi:hypothetical protein